MKIIFILFICTFFSLCISGQESQNQLRIKEVTELMNKAVEKSNYKLAAEFQEELKIRQSIEQAIKDHDIHLAGRLQAQLEKKETRAIISSRPVTHLEKAALRRGYIFIDVTSIGFNNYTSTFTMFDGVSYYTPTETINSYTLGFQFGQHFYFSPPKNNLRFGLSINYFGVMGMRMGTTISGANFNLFRPGLIVNKFFNDNMGLDFSMHFGASFLDYGSSKVPNQNFALSFSPHFKLWYQKINVGLQYNFAKMVYHNATLNNFNLTFGVCL